MEHNVLQSIVTKFNHPSDPIVRHLVDGIKLTDVIKLKDSSDRSFLIDIATIPHAKRLELQEQSIWYTFKLEDGRYGLVGLPLLGANPNGQTLLMILLFNHDTDTYQLHTTCKMYRAHFRRHMLENTRLKYDKSPIF